MVGTQISRVTCSANAAGTFSNVTAKQPASDRAFASESSFSASFYSLARTA